MSELVRPVGLGLAGRGEIEDVLTWAEDARRRGLDSIWVHDTPYERDAVSYCAAIASHVDEIRVALGALSPFTRHPALIAMTISAMDEIAPERIILGLGTGLPLRLAQMGGSARLRSRDVWRRSAASSCRWSEDPARVAEL